MELCEIFKKISNRSDGIVKIGELGDIVYDTLALNSKREMPGNSGYLRNYNPSFKHIPSNRF